MQQNVTFSIGNIALIDKADAQTNFFNSIFKDISGRAKDFIPLTKLLIRNRLDQCLSINRLLQFTPKECLDILGFENPTSERSVYRTLTRLGEQHQIILAQYQKWVKKHKLADDKQFMDWTSGYFEGVTCPLGKQGYSRDGKPGKKQFTLGVSTGMNGIPTALTIQKGNVADKTHIKKTLALGSKVFEPNTMLIFDCGGNTKKVKAKIRKLGFNFLTLKPKKKGVYKKAIEFFHSQPKEKIELNNNTYFCVKQKVEGEFKYIFFSESLEETQIKGKKKKFKKSLEKGAALEKKVKKGKELSWQVCPAGWIITTGQVQKTLTKIKNPFISEIEGFFILESSVDEDPKKILELYKNRDAVEKFIRDLKEGAEMRPVRHFSKDAVIGAILIVFFTKVLVSLTLFLSKNPLVKNLKLLKKYLSNLTVSVLYPKNTFKVAVISNYSVEMQVLFGVFIRKYGDFEPRVW